MEAAQRKALDGNLVQFCNELDLPEILVYLQEKKVLRDHHIDTINVSLV